MKYKHCLSALAFLVASHGYAGKALWTYEALTETTFSLPQNSTATVQYRVTNQSSKTHVLAMKAVAGITQTTTGTGRCSSPFTLAGGASCLLELEVNGSQLQGNVTAGPEVYDTGSTFQGYQPTAANSLNITLTNALTVASLAVLNSPLELFSGNRLSPSAISTLKIKNTSTDIVATNIDIDFSGTPLANKVDVVKNTCSPMVPPGGKCLIKMRPRRKIDQNESDTSLRAIATLAEDEKEAVIVKVMSTDMPSTTTTADVETLELSVGDEYQGGIIAGVFDDGSGTEVVYVVSATDQEKIIWATATQTLQGQALSDANGLLNTKEIVSAATGSVGQPLESYAAGRCTSLNSEGNPYIWYLPANAELVLLLVATEGLGIFNPNKFYWSSTHTGIYTEASIAVDFDSVAGIPLPLPSNWDSLQTYRCAHLAVSSSLDGE
ncbi:MAG: hypothetical protein K0U37_05655 [Gammaproteobacteria bacterium]|nr:hypothetical protein [Gammaproteobacteria bacterium]